MQRRFWFVLMGLLICPTATVFSQAEKKPDLKTAEYQVFLVAGQSNAQGFLGLKDEGLNEPIPVPEPGTVFYYNAAKNEILDAATADKKEYVGNAAGFHNRFAIDYHKATGKKVIFIHEVHGNSGVIPGVTYGGGNWPDTYRAALKKKYESFQTATQSGPYAGKWALAGLIWGQGEAECFLLEEKKKTQAELETGLASLFDGFAQDYGDSFAGGPDKLIKVVLVSVFAFPNLKSDKFYPDSPEWAMTREMQRNVAKTHPNARMVYFATENFFYETVWPNNAVHYYQKQYNEMGRVMAQEIANPGSTVTDPTAPVNFTATAKGAWRVNLAWSASEGELLGKLGSYRIYRRKVGDKDWTWIWQTKTKSMQDESGTMPDTEYEYRVGARNEFGETFSPTVLIKTGRLSKDLVADYLAAAVPASPDAVRALWKALEAGGHTQGLRSLFVMVKGLNAASGNIYNLVSEAGESRNDFSVENEAGLNREPQGFEFTDPFQAKSSGPLIPTLGPFTLLFEVTWTKFPEGSENFGFMAQGRGYPPPPENSRTMFSFDVKNKQIHYYHEDQTSGFGTGKPPIEVGIGNTYALTYNGVNLSWLQPGREPVSHGNTIYFNNFWDTGFELFTGPYKVTPGSYRMPYLATWNRALSVEEFNSVKNLFDQHLN